ncbi:hypothetical protein M407DRAFT_26884 [Tulasnella calospora MUT 4182]|uniref:Uncharacterized protein n=1 Tax=Tulasnella calospora MUT 4182 TaxID=1051891 RepID=A0A0C3QDI0_9AGAM|nr:hypothetical protein M407DRAFT_26884 [Tulasnella calospora MUT 4182]
MSHSHPTVDTSMRDRNPERHRSVLHDLRDVVEKLIEAQSEQFTQGFGHCIEQFHGDNRIQNECVHNFLTFEKRVAELDGKLHHFMRAVRLLGSSSGLISAARGLQRRMAQICEAFRSSAAAIYKSFGEKEYSEVPEALRFHSRKQFGNESMELYLREFPTLLQDISKELAEFLDSLQDIPEFELSDKHLMDTILGFEGWLMYRATGLEDFCGMVDNTWFLGILSDRVVPGDFQTPAVKFYTNSLVIEMGRYLKELGQALHEFIKEGVPAIEEAQRRSQLQLTNMSTVATFLSAVTATTFQYTSIGNDGQPSSLLDQIVRALWISSLVLSVASAINAQLAMHWRAAMYRSPRSALPMWMSLCLNHTPIVLLVASVLTFSIGLVAYTYSSSQGKIVTTCATVLTSLTSVILLIVIFWEAGERWRAYKSHRASREADAGGRSRRSGAKSTSPNRLRSKIAMVIRSWMLSLASTQFRWPLPRWFAGRPDPPLALDELSLEGLPVTSPPPTVLRVSTLNFSTNPVENAEGSTEVGGTHPQAPSSGTLGQLGLHIQTQNLLTNASIAQVQSPVGINYTASDRRFYNHAWRLVRKPGSRAFLNSLPMSPYGRGELKSLVPTAPIVPIKGAGAVHDLKFAPDRRWLAVSFADGTAGLWEVGDEFKWHSSVAGRPGSVMWCSSSKSLLINRDDGVMIWRPLTGEAKMMRRKGGFEAFTWLPDAQRFAAAAGQSLWIANESTRTVDQHQHLSSRTLRIHDMAAFPDDSPEKQSLLVIVGSIKDEPLDGPWHNGLLSIFEPRLQPVRPKNVHPQSRILVYNLETKKAAVEVPLRGHVRHVTVSKNGRFVLVSYKGGAPELWHIEIEAGKVILELCHLYVPNPEPKDGSAANDFAVQTRACFGGDCDEFVVVGTKKGEIYIWDCISSQLGHAVEDVYQGNARGDASAISWCPTNKDRKVPLFACGIQDGVLIWRGKPADSDPLPTASTSTPIPALMATAIGIISGSDSKPDES